MDVDDHGHNPAAWTAVIITLVGSTVGAVALVVAQPWLFFTGLAVIAVGGIAGKIMQVMGLGEAGRAQQVEHMSRSRSVSGATRVGVVDRTQAERT